ncbi:hypothetical protein V501_09060 [Pseudogymnoascus sp. VKM F-4519 (FW-2642)]|nr:hypothetical protein V501_09060 [Pseudogymnoascus sp. VKM F-4519 (FW-2642)]
MKLRNLFSKKSKSDPSEDSKAESFGKAPLGTYVLHEGEGEIVADVANALKYASKESIFGHAETLLGDIERLRRDKALIKSAAYQSHGRHPSLGEIYHNTKGVIFLGTPHRGSDKTDFANIIANVAKVSFRQPNKQLVGVLSPDSDVLENQREQFTTITQNTPIVCIREELPTAIGVIAPEYSASMDGFNVRKDSIPANHMDMIRFSSAHDIGYRRVSGHIVSLVQVQANEENKETQMKMDDILEALRFETIDDREEKIERAHVETFNWILSDQSHCPTEVEGSSSIVPWLSKDAKPICWISGKPGSGKSTLMKYIWTDERTRTHLLTWAGGKPLLLASFCFYERGGSFQKSREGLIRSLLHQIFSQKRELIPIAFKDKFEIKEIKPPRFLSWPKLKNAFEILLTHTSDSFKLCIFADGLDEYRIMDRMEDYTDDDFELFYDGKNDDESVAADTTNVKICLSSRELTPFQGAFEGFPNLRLHNLTATDITIFTKANFHSGIKSIPTVDETDGMDRLAEEIVLKAQGVFLWSIDFKRLDIFGFYSLPGMILILWTLSLLRRDPSKKKSSSDVNLESHPDALIAVKAPFNLIPDEQLEPRRKKMRLRLMSRCGGLLEAPKKHVRFMHQTVKEFFLREELWIHLLPQEPQSSFDPSLALLSACILRLKCLEELVSEPYEGNHRGRYGGYYFGLDYIYIADSMHYAASSESHGANKEAYFSLLDELELTCTQLARASFLRQQIQTNPIEERHWSTLEPMEYGDKKVSKHGSILSVAIPAGLTSYVESKLSGDNISVGAKSGEPPLLAYAVSFNDGLPLLAYSRSDNNAGIGYNLPDISVVRLLLLFGADTNEQYDGTTVWSEAVETGHRCFGYRIWFARGIPTAGIIPQNKRRWIKVMKNLLRHGANPEEICHDAQGNAPSTAKEVIRDILKDSPEYSKDLVELEEIFKARAVSVV